MEPIYYILGLFVIAVLLIMSQAAYADCDKLEGFYGYYENPYPYYGPYGYGYGYGYGYPYNSWYGYFNPSYWWGTWY
jgi:hypothetical protein